MAMDHVSEMISEWEADDRGYREWQYDVALERGIIDPETMDDGEIWDRIHEEDDINDYYRYNSEAEDFANLMRNAVVMSVSEMKDYASDMSLEEYDGDGSPVDFQELDEVYKFGAQNYLSSGRRRDSYDKIGRAHV